LPPPPRLGDNDPFTRDDTAECFNDLGSTLDNRGVRDRHTPRRGPGIEWKPDSALSRLVPRISLVDDIDPRLAAHDAAALVTLLQCLQGIDDFHSRNPWQGSEHKEPPPR